MTAPATIRDVIDLVTKGRLSPEAFVTLTLMVDGRRVTMVVGVDEGAVTLAMAMEQLQQQGQTLLDPRCQPLVPDETEPS